MKKNNMYIEVMSKYSEYRKLFIANLISRFGDSIDSIAFTWLVYQITGKASWSALVFAFNMLPTVLVQPFGGVAVEHRNQKNIMVLSDAARAVLVIGLMLICVINKVQPWMLIVFTLLISTVEAFGLPAGVAIIPKVIDLKDYGTASSLMKNSIVRNLCILGILANAVLVPFNTLLTPWICESLGQDSNMLSAFEIALIIGMAIGALIIPTLKKAISIRLAITSSGMAIGILIYFDSKISVICHGVIQIYIAVIIAALLVGVFAGVMTTMVQIQIMQYTEQNYLARVAALFNALATAAVPITSFIISLVASRFAVVQIFAVGGMVCLALFVVLQIGKIKVEEIGNVERRELL